MTTVIKGDSNINLDFSTGGRITGDFSNGTFANRVAFQTSTTNGVTTVYAIPNGTSSTSGFIASTDSSVANGSEVRVVVNGTTASLTSSARGSGTTLPMTFDVGSERMRIDSSGNVGIGTSSPGARLDVAGNLRFSAANPVIELNNGGPQIYSTVANTLQFASGGGIGSPTERARINSSGQWLFNCTGQTVDAPNTAGGRINETNGNEKVRVAADTQVAFQFYSPTGGTGGPVGSIIVNAASVSYNTSSDYRLKHDIQPMTGALAKVAQLKPVTYKWNTNDSQSQGFIAHELQEVVPECVTGEKDAVDAEGKPVYQGIDTSFLVATLTAALQEQQALIQTLTARVTALEGTQP
jgi:hypothetical protein